ncbi:hypothetical protein [Actinoplanes campanulatus]|uniref:hypothetical protein n=1 Tax=Actinoplanes campanulatus TaxID=113559 RepID=UPI003570C657
MREVCADLGAEPAAFNGENDHVHLLVDFPPETGCGPPGQQPQRRILTPPTASSPTWYTATPGEQALIGLVLRRVRRRRTTENRSGQGTTRALTARPARAFTPGLKAGALAPHSGSHRGRRRGSRRRAPAAPGPSRAPRSRPRAWRRARGPAPTTAGCPAPSPR